MVWLWKWSMGFQAGIRQVIWYLVSYHVLRVNAARNPDLSQKGMSLVFAYVSDWIGYGLNLGDQVYEQNGLFLVKLLADQSSYCCWLLPHAICIFWIFERYMTFRLFLVDLLFPSIYGFHTFLCFSRFSTGFVAVSSPFRRRWDNVLWTTTRRSDGIVIFAGDWMSIIVILPNPHRALLDFSMFCLLISVSLSHMFYAFFARINRPPSCVEAQKIWWYSSTIFQYEELIIQTHPSQADEAPMFHTSQISRLKGIVFVQVF